MKRTMSHGASILLTVLALAGAATVCWLGESKADSPAPVQVAQSTSAILESRAA